MDALNRKICIRLQELAGCVFEEISDLFPEGSYTANQVYEFLMSSPDGSRKTYPDSVDHLPAVCFELVSVEVDSFKCSAPKYKLFQVLHKFEGLARMGKNKMKFNRTNESENMKTNKYYTIECLESGNYLIRDKEHDAALKAAIQEAAHYIRNHGEGMQLEYCRFAHKWLNGRKPSEVTPMKEKDIHGLLYSFLKSIGVSEVKPCASGIEPERVETGTYTICITGTLDKPRKMYQELIEAKGWKFVNSMNADVDILVYGDDPRDCASTKVKKAMKLGTRTMNATEFYKFLAGEPETVERVEVETVETLGISDCTVVPLEESGSIYHILVCSTKAGDSLTFAPEKYFPVLFDEGKNSFRTELDALKFDEIDAFISGECVDKIARGECSEEETDRILSESYTDFVGKLKQAS